MVRSRRVTAAAVCGALALFAAPLRAQSPVVLEGFAARAQSSSDPLFGGLGLSAYSGPFGLRVSGALNAFRSTSTVQDYPQGYPSNGYGGGYGCRRGGCGGYGGAYGPGGAGSTLRVGAWTADADLIFEPFRSFAVGRALLLGFSPYAFGGIGYYAARPVGTADTGLTTVSYGAGVRHQLLGWLGVTAEARFRHALRGDSTYANFDRHRAQYRVGLTISFGGGRRATPIAAPSVVAVPVASPVGITPSASMASVGARIVPRVLDLADSYVDAPYQSGGTAPGGFDAPGFVQYVFGREGVTLPRTVRELARSGMTVSTSAANLRPGDLLFFANDGFTPDHVAIYAGRDRIIHATASGGGVRYDVLGQGARGTWFSAHLVTARRVVDGTQAQDRAPSEGDGAPPAGGSGASRPDEAPQPSGGTAR
ncbi:hypothetical protein tb265_23990 [Gemmatimonadetes bacterium T265]|nr:hypothetical protein tb265_23990 [Gemmatimonadetes bacterium T265]